jgi:hypothetical protein
LKKKLVKFRRQHKYLTKRLYVSRQRISNKIYVTCKSFPLKGIAAAFGRRRKAGLRRLRGGLSQLVIAGRIAVLVDYARRSGRKPRPHVGAHED